MRQALIIDTLRGEDSTGVIVVPNQNRGGEKDPYEYRTADWAKSLEAGHSFVTSKVYMEREESISVAKFVVGHNRAATQGAVVVDNAHPFQEGPITMVHNGTLRSDHTLPETMLDLGVTVDSHAVCHNLALVGTDHKEVEKVISTIDGAFALIWHDARDDSLNIVRNSERPLHFIQSRTDKTIFFASEAEMLALLAKRIKLNVYEDAHYPMEGQLLKFKGHDLMAPSDELVNTFDDLYGQSRYGSATNYPGVYPAGGNCTAKKSLPEELPERTIINGALKEVPQIMVDQLAVLDYSPRDRLQYLPLEVQHGFVSGMIGGTNQVAICYLDDARTKAAPQDGSWTARPVGVKVVGRANVLMVRLVIPYWEERYYNRPLAEVPPDENKYGVWCGDCGIGESATPFHLSQVSDSFLCDACSSQESYLLRTAGE